MHIEHVAPRERIEIPYLIAEVFPLQHFIWTTEKTFEECIFLEGKRYLFLSFEKTMCGTVDCEVAHRVYDRLCDERPPQDGADARNEFFGGEWLDHVIIRAAVQEL